MLTVRSVEPLSEMISSKSVKVCREEGVQEIRPDSVRRCRQADQGVNGVLSLWCAVTWPPPVLRDGRLARTEADTTRPTAAKHSAAVTPQLEPTAPPKMAPTEPPIAYATEAVSCARRLRRATPMARNPAVAAVINEAAATVSVIAGTSCAVGTQSSLSRAGPGPRGKMVIRISPHAMAAAA